MANAGALNQAPAVRSLFRIAGINLDKHRGVSVREMNINTIVDATNDEMVNENEFGIQKGCAELIGVDQHDCLPCDHRAASGGRVRMDESFIFTRIRWWGWI